MGSARCESGKCRNARLSPKDAKSPLRKGWVSLCPLSEPRVHQTGDHGAPVPAQKNNPYRWQGLSLVVITSRYIETFTTPITWRYYKYNTSDKICQVIMMKVSAKLATFTPNAPGNSAWFLERQPKSGHFWKVLISKSKFNEKVLTFYPTSGLHSSFLSGLRYPLRFVTRGFATRSGP